MTQKRKNYDNTYKWNTLDLYKSDDEVLNALEKLSLKIEKLNNYKGVILESSNMLLELLILDTDISMELEKLYIYGHINNDADTTDVLYQELFGKIKNIYTKYLEVSSYIVPELLSYDYEIVDKYIKENRELNKYERSLKHIYRNKEHILNSDVENV